MASSGVLVLQVRKWMQIWEKCSYAHRQVDEQPSKRSKKKGDTSAVAILKIARQLRSQTFETKNHRLELFAQVILVSATPMLQNLRIGLRRRRKGKGKVPVKQRGGWPKIFPKLKEKHETASTLEPEEREFVVDSGASVHMISKKDLNSAELETVTTSRSPTTVFTANGEVQTQEEAIVYVKELDIFLTMKVLEDTQAVLSLGKLCDENGYSYEWINGQKPHLIKNGIRIQCNTENFVPIVVLGLSATSSSSSTSTPTTPSSQEIDHSDHHPAIESSESVDRQARRNPYTSETPEELLHEPTEIPKPKKKQITNKYGEARIPTYQNGCKNSERILWRKEFLNTETHTRVLLMNHF